MLSQKPVFKTWITHISKTWVFMGDVWWVGGLELIPGYKKTEQCPCFGNVGMISFEN